MIIWKDKINKSSAKLRKKKEDKSEIRKKTLQWMTQKLKHYETIYEQLHTNKLDNLEETENP